MKTRINPGIGIGIIVVVVAVIGFLFYRAAVQQQVGTSDRLPPALRAKILGAYGGGQPPARPARNPSASTPGSR